MKEFTSLPWISVPTKVRVKFADATSANKDVVDRELAIYHAKYDDGVIMFENMDYYNWFLLRWS